METVKNLISKIKEKSFELTNQSITISLDPHLSKKLMTLIILSYGILFLCIKKGYAQEYMALILTLIFTGILVAINSRIKFSIVN